MGTHIWWIRKGGNELVCVCEGVQLFFFEKKSLSMEIESGL